ncbi:MAG: GNAT family N-acetyltransferase [Candidatus Nealsonbacteria bacterium]|nr:GNAT family N-acetyltransferase [Candidatus Nealsonbacteria bacterium]
MKIKLKNFILRPFRKGDEPSLQKNINNKKIYEMTRRVAYPYTLEHAKQWVKINIEEEKKENRDMIFFVIDINEEVAGSIGLSSIKSWKAELGYWLGESFWNKGIMTKAVDSVTEYGFEELKLKRIYAEVFSFNKASMRVLEKNDYKFEGVLKNNFLKDGKLIDELVFARLN